MASRSLGTLTIDLVAKVAGWKAGMTEAERQSEKTAREIERRMNKLSADIGSAFAKATGAITVSLSALSALVKRNADGLIGLTTKAAQVTMPAEQFSAYAAAARQADVDVNTFTNSLNEFNQRISEAQRGGSAGDLFRRLGIDPASIKNTEDGMRRVSDALSGYADNAQKTALVQQLFGRNAAQMGIFLSQGTAAIDEQTEAQRRLGNVLDENAQQKLADFDKASKDLHDTLGGLGNRITIAMIPAFSGMTDALREIVGQDGQDATRFFEGLSEIIASVVKVGIQAAGALTVVGKSIAGVMAAITNPSLAKNIFAQMREDINKTYAEFAVAIDKIDDKFANSKIAKRDERQDVRPRLAPVIDSPSPNSSPARRVTDPLDSFRRQVEAMNDALERGQGSQARYEQTVRKLGEAMEEAVKKGGDAAEAQRLFNEGVAAAGQTLQDELDKQAQQEESRLDSIRSKYEESITGLTRAQLDYNRTIQDANELLEAHKITTEQYMNILSDARAKQDELKDSQKETNKFMEEMGLQAARNIQDSLADFLFDPFEKGLKGMVDGFANSLRQMAAQAAAQDIFKRLMGGLSGMGGLGATVAGFFGGGRASGGSIEAGKTYLVGERGPELIYSNTSGYVANAAQTRDSLGGKTQIFNITTPNADSFRASQRQIMRQAKGAMA